MENVVVADFEGILGQRLQLLSQGGPGLLVETRVCVQPVVGQGHVRKSVIDEERVVDRLRIVGQPPGAKDLQGPLGHLGPTGEMVNQRQCRGLGRIEAIEVLEHLPEIAVTRQGLELLQGNGVACIRRTQQHPRSIVLNTGGWRNQIGRHSRCGQEERQKQYNHQSA